MNRKLLIILIIPFLGIAQVKKTVRKVIPLFEQRQIFINSAMKVNGKTRIDIKIDLPPNTVEWYYSFSTTPSTSENSLKLFSQVSKIYDQTGITANVISALSVPDGFAPVDVFLMDYKGKENFYNKDFFGAYQYTDPGSFAEGTAKNTRQGKIIIDDVKKGTFFLGIRNPSLNTGINVLIEAVAVIEIEEFDNSKWSKENKNQLFLNVKNALAQLGNSNYSESIIDEFTGCLISNIVKNYTPEDFENLADYEKRIIYKELIKKCNPNDEIKFE